MTKIRINKLLADLGLVSRRGADQLISSGKVLLNNRKAKLGEKVDPAQDKLRVEGKEVALQRQSSYQYWLLNKPVGVVSTTQDPQGRKTVAAVIKPYSSARLYPVGRLDYESEGLLLLTDDGELAQRLTHPKYQVSKVYLVWVNGIFHPAKLERLRRGVYLREGRTKVDEIELLDRQGRDFSLQIKIHEGKKREIRRLCAKVGWEVQRLQRIQLANLLLGDLALGQARALEAAEITALRHSVALAA